jgi:hypothetical protein
MADLAYPYPCPGKPAWCNVEITSQRSRGQHFRHHKICKALYDNIVRAALDEAPVASPIPVDIPALYCQPTGTPVNNTPSQKIFLPYLDEDESTDQYDSDGEDDIEINNEDSTCHSSSLSPTLLRFATDEASFAAPTEQQMADTEDVIAPIPAAHNRPNLVTSLSAQKKAHVASKYLETPLSKEVICRAELLSLMNTHGFPKKSFGKLWKWAKKSHNEGVKFTSPNDPKSTIQELRRKTSSGIHSVNFHGMRSQLQSARE